MSRVNIDKKKFEFVDINKLEIVDEVSKTKPVSYYQDAYGRFKKNKASVVATILIGIIFIFTIIGPFMRNYTLVDDNPGLALQFQNLPAKVPGLEKLGIFDGTRVINGRNKLYWDQMPEGVVVEIVSETVTADGTVLQDALVNYYRYDAYIKTYGNRIESSVIVTSLTYEQYQEALALNAVIQLHSYDAEADRYNVQLDVYQYAFQTDADHIYFWFGTNALGEDVFTNLWIASRTSILLAVLISVINIIIGVIIGSFVGYYGGLFDLLFERFIDILANLPFLIILTLMILRRGNGILTIIMAFIMTGWIGSYSITRVQFYRYRNREYVLAGRTYGARDSRLIFKHIFPNAIGTLITSFSLAIPSFIFTESVYSFLGIINYAESTSIGRMLSEGQAVMQRFPHLLLFPAVYISILMLSFNLFSNGLRDAFNPSLRGVE